MIVQIMAAPAQLSLGIQQVIPGHDLIQPISIQVIHPREMPYIALMCPQQIEVPVKCP
ncbi:hypothetical protein D3C80_2184040 [compost metagenome]